jgi:phospholipid/cholesterol/gamma-HCH transport system substrate-binding protein
MQSNAVETLIGTIVIALAAGFLVFAYSVGKVGKVEGYNVVANFDRVDGVSEGTDVRISGIKIGSVTAAVLDPATYFAKVTMSIEPAVKIPEDSSVKVAIDGLLGSPYLAVQPGGSQKVLADGGEIANTQPSIDIVGLLSRAIFSPSSSSKSGSGGKGGGQSEPQPPPQTQPQGELPPGGGP